MDNIYHIEVEGLVPLEAIHLEHEKIPKLRKINTRTKYFRNLKYSIKEVGLMHPLSLVKLDGKLYIVDGQTRYMVAIKLGYKEIRARWYESIK